MELVRRRIADGSVLGLVEQSLKAGVLEELKGWTPTECGTPQGAVISPLLANLYLNPMDHEMDRRNGVRHPKSLGGVEFLQARHRSRFRVAVS